jgi:hypothetical protein
MFSATFFQLFEKTEFCLYGLQSTKLVCCSNRSVLTQKNLCKEKKKKQVLHFQITLFVWALSESHFSSLSVGMPSAKFPIKRATT